MSYRSHAANKQTQIEQNPIHVDSKWFKKIVALTGSMEEAMLLSDTIIYHRNRYKAFKVGDDYLYGLIYSAKDYQENLHIPYRKAMNLPKQLVEKGFLEAHDKKFMCNRTFYTPTKKALENLYKIHFSGADSSLENKQSNLKKTQPFISIKTDIKTPILTSSPYEQSVQPLLRIRTTASAYTHNPYKDKHKDKKNNNHNNLLKNYSLLENSQPQNVKTVIFDFSKFNLFNIQCEGNILDYFTVKQNEVISTIAFSYHDSIDIVIFNQILKRSDLKKEAKDFKQLVTLAYFEATKKNKVVATDDQLESESDGMTESQNVKEIVIDSVAEPVAKNEAVSVAPKADNHNKIILPEITADTIQAMIEKRQNKPMKNVETDAEIKLSGSEIIATENTNQLEILEEESQPTTLQKSSYLLNQSNRLYLIETLSAQGINDATLILKTAENIIGEYVDLSFNDLLDGVVYRLVTLPEKQRQKELINQAPPMPLESESENIIDALVTKEANIEQPGENHKKIITGLPNQALLSAIKGVQNSVVDIKKAQAKITEKPSEIDKEAVHNLLNNGRSMTARSESKPITDIMILKEKTQEKINEIRQNILPDLLNKSNQTFLIEGLNSAGVGDKKLVLDTAKEIVVEYPDLNFKDLLEGVIYRLVTLPLKQKKQDKINQSLMAEFGNMADSKNLDVISTVVANQSKPTQTDDALLPQLSDLVMSHADTYVLRQDWASKADQNFYTGVLPDSQQLALVAMIDYVKRKGITITLDQEVYEWLYHMASNKDYYYSRAKNFKHWCNIVMRQLMQRRLHKPAWFDGWRSRIEGNSLAVAA